MRSTWKLALRERHLLLICLLSVALGFSIAANFYNHPTTPAIAASSKTEAMADWRSGFIQVADKLQPCVVNITCTVPSKAGVSMPNFDDFFGFPFFGGPRGRAPKPEDQTVGGSGVIVRSDGYILTNNHVVEGANKVKVKLPDGAEYTATKVLTDPYSDLAVVKIDANNLPAASFADSDKAKVGEWVIAIGNPFGMENTLTVGVVSGLLRDVHVPNPENPHGGTYYPDAIQTDASINPGNSGGPLVDIDGSIIGINSAIYSQSGGNMGIGFAIPSSTAKFVMEQLIEHGKVTRGYLGLAPENVTPKLSGKLGTKQGALVEQVDEGSPAEKGGIEPKDVIVKINDKDIKSAIDLRRTVQRLAPGTTATVELMRDGKPKTVEVKIGTPPSEGEADSNETSDKIGLQVQSLTPDLADKLGVSPKAKGVVVKSVEPNSAAARVGMQPGDLITEIDNTPITSVSAFSKAVKSMQSGDTVMIVIQREGRSFFVQMPVD